MRIKGTLEVRQGRGVVYFHDELGNCLLRIEGLTVPVKDPAEQQIDVRLVRRGRASKVRDPHQIRADRASGVTNAELFS